MRGLALLFFLLTAAGVPAIENVAPFDDPAMQARYEHIVKELRCLVCQNESIADSNALLAADLRREVREMMIAGKSDAEIKVSWSSLRRVDPVPTRICDNLATVVRAGHPAPDRNGRRRARRFAAHAPQPARAR
jgi:cytochrome c-type biogenesis protein CcmH